MLGFTAAIIALLAAAVASYVRFSADRKPAPADPPQPIPVIAATVRERDVPIVLNGLGAVTPLNTATVRSQITGLITSVNFQEGQFVKKGDLLA
jgi:multidrug efflux system membrane fusion protein